MKQLELKDSDIVGYLPHKLRVKYFESDRDYNRVCELTELNVDTGFCKIKIDGYLVYSDSIHSIKPILRPTSDLYKPCLPDGKIPIVELAKLEISGGKGSNTPMFSYEIHSDEWGQKYLKYNPYLLEGAFDFCFFEIDKSFKKYQRKDNVKQDIGNQHLLFQKLYEWHIDINNLIGQGLAVDINTVQG